MSNFARLRTSAGLSIEEARALLGVSPGMIAAYEEGKLAPMAREIQVLRGLATGSKNPQADSKGAENESAAAKPQCLPHGAGLRWRMSRAKPSFQKRSVQRSSGLTALELCAGGGGSALGLEQAGFEAVALLDNDAHACATLRHNRPYWNVIQADIRRFNSDYWQGVDLLAGGLPCPPFSIAGKQLGEDDERNLFPAMLRIVKSVRPRALLIENVRGIFTERFSAFRARIDTALQGEGFETYWTAFNAVNFGVPQERFRVFLVALRRGHTRPLKWPIAMSAMPPTVGETIGDLMAERGWRGVSAWIKQANAPAPTIVGGSHKHGGPDLGPTRARREWARLGVDGLGLADEAPARDFVGMPRLTVRMVARLQSFPDDWSFVGSKTHAYRQVGNALPVKLAFSVAQAVRECLS